MDRLIGIGRRAGLALGFAGLLWAGAVVASGANSQRAVGTGTSADGSDGLLVTWGSNSQFQARLANSDQVYNTGATPQSGSLFNSVVLRVDRGTSAARVYHSSNSNSGGVFGTFTQGTQSSTSGTGTAADPWVVTSTLRPSLAVDNGIQIEIRDQYIKPQAWFTRRITLTGMPATGASIKFYQFIDTLLNGGDAGPGFSRTSPGNTSGRPDIVGVIKSPQFEALWWEPSSGTPNWDRYFSGTFNFPYGLACTGTATGSPGTCTTNSGNLNNVVDSNAGTDNGLAAQWDIPSGSSTYTVEYRVTFAIAAVDLTKQFNPTTINTGGVSTLTFDLSNKSVNSVASINFTDALPSGVVVAPTPNVRTSCPAGGALGTSLPAGMTVNATAGGGTLQVSGARVNGAATTGGQLACQIAVDVTSNTVGVYHNTNASISGTSNLVNLVGDEVLTVVQPQLTASKTVNGALAAGQTGAASDGYFSIGLQNTGSGPTAGAITIRDTLPAGFSLVSASSAQGTVNCGTLPATGNVTCTFTPASPIAVGASASVRLNVAIAAATSGSPTNHVAVAGGGDPDPLPTCPASGNPQCAQVTVPVAVNIALSLAKREVGDPTSYTPGSTSTYTLQACNNTGPAVANGATVSDPLPNGVTLTGPWTCAGTTTGSGTATCPASGGVAGGNSVQITGVVLPVGTCINVQVPVRFNSDPAAYTP
ncbi:DUF7933 domain-containing protein [Lysobacter sp. CA199]|uniref:DUF7933 domain-containing protein n=1 Tax=Lysobacter sp. CA199 TaxID=3455608 RepID=UPI003F8D3786